MHSEFEAPVWFSERIRLTCLAYSSCLSISPCFCWTKQISQWRLNNIHLKRQPEKGEKKERVQSTEREKEMNRRQRQKQGQRGYEGFCHTEHFLMSNKPHRRVVKRRPHSQAFELSKALPCTHGLTYVPPPSPPPSSTQILYIHTLSATAVRFRSISRDLSDGRNDAWTWSCPTDDCTHDGLSVQI